MSSGKPNIGTTLAQWIYSVVDKEEVFIPPSKRYMGFIKRGASNVGFPKDYLSFLENIKTVNPAEPIN
jgi:hypothetical protein